MLEPIVIVIAFFAGLIFRRAGYPPLLGYLLAGFIGYGFDLGDHQVISSIADLGILLLLFTIGLKLNLKELATPEVWGVASLHMMVVIPLLAGVIMLAGLLLSDMPLPGKETPWLLAFALSFSSTVFAVKTFDERGENTSLHAMIAIGILIVQDLIAVVYLAASSGEWPSLWAFALLAALPLLRPLLKWLLRLVGHGELLVLFGIGVALIGAELFEWVRLKGDLGALVFGVLLGNSSKRNELYKNLINFKDLFLIGFFISIGYNGLPSGSMIIIAVALNILLFFRPLGYFFLFTRFKLRARTSLLTSLALFNYSEFGLIVAALAVNYGFLPGEWVTTLALAMSLSFFIAVPFNTHVHLIYARYSPWLQKLERKELIAQEAPTAPGKAKIVVMGMGRVGLGAYQYLHQLYPDNVVGVDANDDKILKHRANGVRCVHGDATDSEFLQKMELPSRSLIFVSLTNHNENVEVVKLLQQLDYLGKLAVVARFPDEKQELEDIGCITFNLYAEAGHGFAEDVMRQIEEQKMTS